MRIRRRITIRMEASARNLSKVIFWMRHGHSPMQAWSKAKVTL